MWDGLEMVRIEGDFLSLAGTGEIWDRVENVAWQQREREKMRSREKVLDLRSRLPWRLAHAAWERAARQRNKVRDGAVRCCSICRRMYVATRQQLIDGTRHCSQQCAGRYRYSLHPPPKPVRYVTIDGKRRRLTEWAKHFGITVSRVYRRMEEGMSDVEALTKPKNTGGPKRIREVTIDGETRSVSDWARHFGIAPHSVYVRVRRGMDIATALSAPKADELRRPVTIDGETRSLTAWAKHFGISQNGLASRLKKGMSLVEALTQPKTPGAGKKPRRAR